MKYKTDETGKFILMDEQGFPLIITDDEKEFGLDGIDLYSKIPTLSTEAKAGRIKIKELSDKLLKFGDLSPEAALEAVNTVKNFEDKDMVAAKDVEKLKTSLGEAWEAKFKETSIKTDAALKQKDDQIEQHKEDLFTAMVASQFAKSAFFTGPEPKTRLTPEIGLAYFKDNFKVEDDGLGKKVVVGYYSNGEKIVSQQNPLNVPSFDEAIGAIIENDPGKERILEESTGSGARKGRASGIPGPKQVRANDIETVGMNLEKIASGELTVVEAA
jgi:hypothetical protein